MRSGSGGSLESREVVGWSVRVALLAGAISWLTAAALAWLYVAASNGFGAGDLPAFALWSSFHALLIAALTRPVLRLTSRRSRASAVLLAGLVGALAGIAYTLTVALALGPWVGTFSFPILYLWAVAGALGLALTALILPVPATELARPPLRVRRVLGVAAVVLVAAAALPFLMLLGNVTLWGRAEHEVHLIPAGYEGPVVIIYADSSGAPQRREGKARLHEIPGTGVLRTRFPPNSGWSAPDYYYVDAAGRRTPILRGAPCADSLPGDPVQACLMPMMFVFSAGTSGRTTDHPTPAYKSYVVGRRADAEVLEARWDSLVRWVIFRDTAYRAP